MRRSDIFIPLDSGRPPSRSSRRSRSRRRGGEVEDPDPVEADLLGQFGERFHRSVGQGDAPVEAADRGRGIGVVGQSHLGEHRIGRNVLHDQRRLLEHLDERLGQLGHDLLEERVEEVAFVGGEAQGDLVRFGKTGGDGPGPEKRPIAP